MCTFFGRQKTNDFLLPLIITFLNDRHDWELRCAFFQNIVGVSAFVGMDSLQLFILPCILQALTGSLFILIFFFLFSQFFSQLFFLSFCLFVHIFSYFFVKTKKSL